MSTFFLLGFLSVAAVAGYDYELRVESTKAAREAMSKWDDKYLLQIFKGFNDGSSDTTQFNTVWQSVPKAELQELSGEFYLAWDNPIIASFKRSVRTNEILKKYTSNGSSEFGLGESVSYGCTGQWSEPTNFLPSNKLEVQNDANFNYRAILYSKGTDGDYTPFYTSPGLIPSSALRGSPVVKLKLYFSLKLGAGAFVGDIDGLEAEEVDFTLVNSQTVCIDKMKGTDKVVFKKGECPDE